MTWDWDFLIFRDIQKRLLTILKYQFETIVFLKIISATLLIFLTGYLFTRLLMRKGVKLNFLEIIGTSYLLGFGIVPFILLILSTLLIELRWLYLFIPLLIIDVLLISFTFPKDLGLNISKSLLYNLRSRLLNKKDVLFFFIIVYFFVFSFVMLPVFRGAYLGIKMDARIYAGLADFILRGNSPFSDKLIYFQEEDAYWPFTPYTLFYIFSLVSITMLTNTGDVYQISYLFGPIFSISGLPLTAYILLDKVVENKMMAKLGVFLLVFASEEIIYWSLFGKGIIVAISYILLSLNFFIRVLRRNTNETKLIVQKDTETNFEVLLSSFFAGVAFLYHASAFIFPIMIAFFLIFEVLHSRQEIKEIARPVGLFLSINVLFTLIWIPSLFIERPMDWKLPQKYEWYAYLFLKANPLVRLLYPFLFHYVPARQFPPPLPFAYALFGFGTGSLFGLALISVIFDRSWTKKTEKRLFFSCFVLAYIFPLHPLLTGSEFYFIPNRFIMYLEVVSSLLIVISLGNNLRFGKFSKRYPFVLTIIWFIIFILTLRWYVYSLWIYF